VAYPKVERSDERMVGAVAKQQQRRNILSTYQFFRRFLGSSVNEFS